MKVIFVLKGSSTRYNQTSQYYILWSHDENKFPLYINSISNKDIKINFVNHNSQSVSFPPPPNKKKNQLGIPEVMYG